MHGLNTINQLNGLADHNAPGAPEAAIAAADAKREGLPSPLTVALIEILDAEQKATNVANLIALSTSALLGLTAGGLHNSPLELALAAQLRYYAGNRVGEGNHQDVTRDPYAEGIVAPDGLNRDGDPVPVEGSEDTCCDTVAEG